MHARTRTQWNRNARVLRHRVAARPDAFKEYMQRFLQRAHARTPRHDAQLHGAPLLPVACATFTACAHGGILPLTRPDHRACKPLLLTQFYANRNRHES